MAKAPATITAAKFTATALVIAAIVGAIATFLKSGNTGNTAVTTGNGQLGPLAIFSGSKNITINYNEDSPERSTAISNLTEKLAQADSNTRLNSNELDLVKVALTSLQERTEALETPRLERFVYTDKTRMLFADKHDGAVLIYFVLSNTPQITSLRLQYENYLARPDTVTNLNNVVVTCLRDDLNRLKQKEFFITYTPSRGTGQATSIVTVVNGSTILIDNVAYEANAKYVSPDQ